MMTSVPSLRVRSLNRSPVRGDGQYVLYWMTACRRPFWNYGLERAAQWARKLIRPLLVLEGLRCDYPWASDRLHAFILHGMQDNGTHFSRTPAHYYPYVETERGGGKGLLEALAREASLVVTDDFPAFFLPRMLDAAARKVPVSMEAVDSNGLLPMRAAPQAFPTAFAFRRFLQRELPAHLEDAPREDPLAGEPLPRMGPLPGAILERWAPCVLGGLDAELALLRACPVSHGVGVVLTRGGCRSATGTWRRFHRERLSTYPLERNHPDARATSGLSPYLHFGHLSVHEIFRDLASAEEWTMEKVARSTTGKRSGWWGMSEAAEAFLDQLVTWRELGFNMCAFREDYDRYESLPQWAREDLDLHGSDPRPIVYTLEELETAQTHDRLWNAAQRELIEEGALHNYLRMLWGKKILEWSASPREALRIMIELNNKYALDGRDPNSYSGIFWILGRYDRPWGPVRPIFGKIRYMSSASTLRKLRVEEYLARYA